MQKFNVSDFYNHVVIYNDVYEDAERNVYCDPMQWESILFIEQLKENLCSNSILGLTEAPVITQHAFSTRFNKVPASAWDLTNYLKRHAFIRPELSERMITLFFEHGVLMFAIVPDSLYHYGGGRIKAYERSSISHQDLTNLFQFYASCQEKISAFNDNVKTNALYHLQQAERVQDSLSTTPLEITNVRNIGFRKITKRQYKTKPNRKLIGCIAKRTLNFKKNEENKTLLNFIN